MKAPAKETRTDSGNTESPGTEDHVTGTQTVKSDTDTGEASTIAPVPERIRERWRRLSESAEAEERQQAQFKKWLDSGSDDLLEAWVSVSPCANDRAVEHWRLPDIVEVIRKRSQLGVTRYERPVDVDLTEVTGKVNTLYGAGYEAALRLNAKTYARLLGMLGINATPNEVAPVVEQPKKNEKVFYLTALRVGGEEYPCERTRYHDPVAMGKDKAKDVKMKQVPGVTFAGTFDPHRDASYLYQTTGLFTLDADALDDVEAVYKRIIKDPSVALCFRSITGSGLKVVVYGPRVSTAEEYTTVYNRIFALKGREWGIADRLDVATKDCSRLCFLSYDPDAYVNWDAVALKLDDLLESEQEPKHAKANASAKVTDANEPKPKSEPKPAASDEPLDIDWKEAGGIPDLTWEDIGLKKCCEALCYISPDCDHETWRVVTAALRLGYGDDAFDIFDYWSSLASDGKYPGRDACWKKWRSFNRDDGNTPKSILKLGREAGWRPPNERVHRHGAGSVEGEKKNESEEERAARLDALLDATAFDFDRQPPPLREVYNLAGKVICTPGNLTTITASIKTGKSAVVGAMMAATVAGKDDEAIHDLLGFISDNRKGLAVVHLDTEQSRGDFWHLDARALNRAGLLKPPKPDWFHSHCLTGKDCYVARAMMERAVKRYAEQHGGVHSVIIDGVADLVADVNDATECNAFVARLHGMAIEYDCPIIVIIHFNPGTEKSRGHLGSQLERKAETNLRLDKNEDEVTTIWSIKQRRAPILRKDGPSFRFDDERGIHVTCATPVLKKGRPVETPDALLLQPLLNGERLTLVDWVTGLALLGVNLKKPGLHKRATKMRAEGKVRHDKDGFWSIVSKGLGNAASLE